MISQVSIINRHINHLERNIKIQPYEAIKIGSEPFSENNNFWSGRPVLPGILNQVQPTSTSIATSGNFVPPLPSQMSNSMTQSLSNYASAHSSSTRCPPKANSLLPSDLRVQKSKEIEMNLEWTFTPFTKIRRAS